MSEFNLSFDFLCFLDLIFSSTFISDQILSTSGTDSYAQNTPVTNSDAQSTSDRILIELFLTNTVITISISIIIVVGGIVRKFSLGCSKPQQHLQLKEQKKIHKCMKFKIL